MTLFDLDSVKRSFSRASQFHEKLNSVSSGMSKKTYHFIYKTTNSVNGKYYKGMHSTDDVNDGYVGSGIILSNAVQKYGDDKFTREIIQFADTVEELREMESAYITNEDIVSDTCYNIAMGGRGGKIVLYPEHPRYEEVKNKLRDSHMARGHLTSARVTQQHATARETGTATCMMGKSQSKAQKAAVSLALKGRKKSPESVEKRRAKLLAKHADPDYINPLKGRTLSKDHREKISISHADVSGERNPNYGKRKFFNPVTGESVRVSIGGQPAGWVESSVWRKMNRRKSDTIKT